MKIEFFCPMKPPTKTHQHKKLAVSKKGKPIIYTPQETKAVQAKLSAHVGRHAPDEPLAGALRVTQKWIWTGKVTLPTPRSKKPDCDNISKILLDVMTSAHFWKDDAQVSSLTVEKWQVPPDQPTGIWISVETYDRD